MFEPGWLRKDVELAAERVREGFPTPREKRLEAAVRAALEQRQPTEHGFFYLPDQCWLTLETALKPLRS